MDHLTTRLRRASSLDIQLEASTPLWQRVPVTDERGGLLADFMMVIPGLSRRPRAEVERAAAVIHDILARYHRAVVFADLNLKLNVLWVSVRPIPGICLELPAVIHEHLPEAKLVGQQPDRR